MQIMAVIDINNSNDKSITKQGRLKINMAGFAPICLTRRRIVSARAGGVEARQE